jgi:hypothetical protein
MPHPSNRPESRLLRLTFCAIGLLLLASFPCLGGEQSAASVTSALTPKEYYDRIGNPKWDLFKQIEAYKQLRTTASPRAEACYWLAESYISGKTGKGGPAFEVNRTGYPPNRTVAYKEAIPLLEEAAKDDHIPSLIRLYDLYHVGKYIPADHDKALSYLLQLDRLDQCTYRPVLERFYVEELTHVKSASLAQQATETLANSGYGPAKSAQDREIQRREPQSGSIAVRPATVHDTPAEPPPQHIQSVPPAGVRNNGTSDTDSARTAESPQSLSRSDIITCGVLIALLLALVGAAIGTYLGLNGRVVVFYRKSDLFLSILIVIGILLMIPFAINKNPALSVLIWTVLALLGLAAWISYWANRSILKAMVSLPTKLTMSAILVFIAAFAWSSWTKAAAATKKGQRREAAKQATFAIGATGGTLALYKFCQQLIRSERL